MSKMTLQIAGMHCASCELFLENQIKKVPGVNSAKLNYKTGEAEIFYAEDKQKPQQASLVAAVTAAGYKLGNSNKQQSQYLLSSNKKDYRELGKAFLLFVALIFLAKSLGFSGLSFAAPTQPQGFGAVMLVGLVAGFSTCMALLGGLVLGFSAQKKHADGEESYGEAIKPHVLFNLGRIGGYFLLGGALGYFGSLLAFSTTFTAIMTIVVGLVMLLLGLRLTGISPLLSNRLLSLPSSIGKFFVLNNDNGKKGPLLLGALTFFLPCGFTQAMQLYALSSGSFLSGGLIMGAFALGTVPGLLGVGGLSSFFKRKKSQFFFRFAGVVVVAMALFNISNGLNLGGWKTSADSSQLSAINNGKSDSLANRTNVTMENGMQVVRMTQKAGGYVPNSFIVKKGVPVKWIITSESQSCASSLVMSKYNIRKQLNPGENAIEFTPTESGKIPFSCSMGMYTGSFIVTDDEGKVTGSQEVNSAPTSSAAGSGSCPMMKGSGGSCGGGTQRQQGTTANSCH